MIRIERAENGVIVEAPTKKLFLDTEKEAALLYIARCLWDLPPKTKIVIETEAPK